MPKCQLISYENPLPGNYPYVDPSGRVFAAQPTPEGQAGIVSGYRSGNSLPRASVKECLEDVDRYQCQRLGCNRMYCRPMTPGQVGVDVVWVGPAVASGGSSGGGCRGCGASV